MLVKRISVACFDFAALVLLGAVIIAGTPAFAYAYVDPSVMTYTIQALAGVAVALSTVFGVVYRRFRKRIVRTLGIDENKGKVIDPDVERVDPDRLDEVNAKAAAFWAAAPKPGEATKWGIGKRALRALIVAIFLSGTLFIVAPFELVASNSSDLLFGLNDVWLPMVKVALLAAAVVWALLTIVPGRVGDALAALACALGVCLWAQAMFMNGGLPSADGAEINWANYAGQSVLSAIVWVVIIAAFVVLSLVQRRLFRPLVVFVAVALVFVQGVGVASLFLGFGQAANARPNTFAITQKGMFDVSSESNVIVIVLDMYDTKDLTTLYTSDRSAFDELTGFTWYTDSTGSLIPTRMAIPYLLSGEFPRDGDTYSSYVENRMNRSTFIEDIAAAGYSIGIYTDTFPYPSTVGDKCDYIMNIGFDAVDYKINEEGTIQILIQTALYRDLPWMFKEGFWYYTEQLNKAMNATNVNELGIDERLYVIDDAAYDDTLLENGLSVVDRGENGSFRFIHLEGAHYPYTIDENGDTVEGNSTREAQAKGSLKIASDYIRALKETGVYDDSTVIITADHGYFEFYTGENEHASYASTPIWLIKPAQSEELDEKPMKVVTNVSTGHMDFCATVLKAMGADYSDYGPATSDVVPSSPRLREYYYLKNDIRTYDDVELQQYYIDGFGPNFNSWTFTGKTYPNDDKKYHN